MILGLVHHAIVARRSTVAVIVIGHVILLTLEGMS